MRRGGANSRRGLVACVVLLVLCTWGPLRVTRIVSVVPHALFKTFVGLPAGWAGAVTDRVKGRQRDDPAPSQLAQRSPEDWDWLERKAAQAERLYQNERARRQELQRRNQELSLLRELLGGYEMASIYARVIRVNTSERYPLLTLNQGMDQGIEVGQVVVVDGYQVFGFVRSVTPLTCEVEPVYRVQDTLPVRIVPSRIEEQVNEDWVRDKWVQWDADLQAFICNDFEKTQPVNASWRVGDRVFLRMEDMPNWPQEAGVFLLGEIVEYGDAPNDPEMYYQAVIRPVIRFPEVRQVMVIVPREAVEQAEEGGA